MSVTDPAEPARPTGGVDWAKDDHAVAIVDHEGEQIGRFPVAHDAAGLRTLVRKLLAADVAEVGIERPDGPVVEALRAAGLVVYVIPPGQLKNLRSRYGSAGNKDDRFDAYVLADVVRTDRRRLRPLLVDAPATTALRQTVRARKDLVAHRVAVANQLRAHLQICFPGAVGLFADIDSDISLRFLERFPTQDHTQLGCHNPGQPAWLTSAGCATITCPRPCTHPACPQHTAAGRPAHTPTTTPCVCVATFIHMLPPPSHRIEALAAPIAATDRPAPRRPRS